MLAVSEKDAGEQVLDQIADAFGVADTRRQANHSTGNTGSGPASAERRQIGPYKLLEQIGQGGFGTVYMAEQQRPVRRKVALKILNPGMDSREVIARFEAERQALAMMDHPNIARVLEGGTTDQGRPYFVMELVRGVPITEYCRTRQLPTRDRLKLLIDVCHAVQHAHLKGIIHRDLKPTNVLVGEIDGKPSPRVIDFGIAKATGQQLTEHSLFTVHAQLIGTPQYMSPEQTALSGVDVDTRSDVYSLGVLLYELLTGSTPVSRETLSKVDYDELRRIIREDDPPRPSERVSTLHARADQTAVYGQPLEAVQLSSQLRGELDWIAMQALEKDRNRRYQSASDLAADIERYLCDEPVQACPPSWRYRVSKYVRRNKGLLITTVLVLLVSLVGTGVSLWQANQANSSRRQLEEKNWTLTNTTRKLQNALSLARELQAESDSHREHAEALLHVAELQLAAKAWKQGDLREAERILRANSARLLPGESPGFVARYLQRKINGLSADGQQHGRLIDQDKQQLWYVNQSRDGRWMVTCGDHGWVRIYDAQNSFQFVRQIDTEHGEVNSVDVSPNGTLLVSAGDDGTVGVWSFPEGRLLRRLDVYPGEKVFGVRFVNDDRRIVTCGTTNRVIVWDATTGESLVTWLGDRDSVESVAVRNRHPDDQGDILSLTTPRGRLQVLLAGDAATTQLNRPEQFDWEGAVCSAYSFNRQWEAVGYRNGAVRILDIDGREVRRLDRPDKIDSISVTDDGTMICTDRGGAITVDFPAPKPYLINRRRIWTGMAPRLPGLTLARDGLSFITAGTNGEIRQWKIDAPSEQSEWTTLPNPESSLPHGPVRFLQNPDRILRITDLNFRDFPRGLMTHDWPEFGNLQIWRGTDNIECVDVCGGIIVAGTTNGKLLKFRDLRKEGQPVQLPLFDADRIDEVHEVHAYSDGQRVLVRSSNGLLMVVDVRNGQHLAERHFEYMRTASLSPDGETVAVCEHHTNQLLLVDSETLEIRHRCLGHQSAVQRADFSQDGRLIVSVGDDRTGFLWDRATGQQLNTLSGHQSTICDVAFSPDSRLVATFDFEGHLKLWSIATGGEMMNWSIPEVSHGEVNFSPDGHWLFLSRIGGAVTALDARPITSSESTGVQP